LVFAGLCLATTGLLLRMSLGRSGLFLLGTCLLTALFFGIYRLEGGSPVWAALAKMTGEANYAFLILFMVWQRKVLPRSVEFKGSLAVVGVSLLHLALNLTLTGLWQLGVMSLQVLVLIGWVTLEAWRLWRAQPHFSRWLLAVLVSAHGLAELAVRSAMVWQAWMDPATVSAPGWTDARSDWLWVTFFLGFMTQLGMAGVVAQTLRRDKARLEQMVQQLGSMLQDKESLVMALMASNAARQGDPHLASLAHELRQPLGSVQLNAEYLASGPGLSPEEEGRVLQAILRENHRAVAIVQGLRSLFTEQAPAHQRLDLSAWLGDWAARQARALEQPFNVQLACRVQGGVQVMGNAVQLEMVLQNLVNNAVEALAGRAQGQIELSLQADGRMAVLEVADNGPGLPQNLQDKVFEMSFSTKSQGMGLGLWLSRRIAQMHRGELVCVAQAQGTRMRLSLPLDAA
jgi:signal transduction histidine kinase